MNYVSHVVMNSHRIIIQQNITAQKIRFNVVKAEKSVNQSCHDALNHPDISLKKALCLLSWLREYLLTTTPADL